MSPLVPDLPGCAKDAELMYNAVTRCGAVPTTDITLLTNEDARLSAILDRIGKLAGRTDTTGLIIYFACHAFSVDSRNYLVPWDGQLDRSRAGETCLALCECISQAGILEDKPVLLLIDACRRGHFRSATGIQPMLCREQFCDENIGRVQILLSTPPGYTEDFPSRNGHGMFSYHLSETLGNPGNWRDGWLDFGKVYHQVASRMVARSSEQHMQVCQPCAATGGLPNGCGLETSLDTNNGNRPRVQIKIPAPYNGNGRQAEDNGLIDLDLPAPTSLLIHALALVRAGSYREAYERIRSFPGWERDKHLLTAAGVTLRMLRDYKRAKSFVARALSIDHGYAHAHLTMGNILLLEKNYNEAEYYYLQAVKLDGDYSLAHYGLGTLYAHQDKFTTALVHYLKALQLNPCWPMTHCGLGFIYHKLGRVDLAVSEYQEAVELDPELFYTYYGLGRAMKALKEFTPAETNLRECLRLNPEMAAGFYELGELLRILGRNDEAREMYRRSLELDVGYMPSHVGLAGLLAQNGETEKALARLESALAMDPSFARTHVLIAELKLRLGMYAPAQYHAKMAASLASPGDDDHLDSQRLLSELAGKG